MGNRRRLDLRRLDLRRSRAPQGPIRHEVVRSRLVDALGRRFDVAVTTIVAGPGFGQSTLLAQAIRANQGAPRGIDAWVACEPGDETVERLAGALADAIVPGSRANKSPHAAVLEALRSVSPLDICLVVDDVHELPNGSSAVAFIGELIRRLPAHVHLVLSGRALPDLPLARLQAADQLLALVEDDLAFTEDEVRHVARLAGRRCAVRRSDDETRTSDTPASSSADPSRTAPCRTPRT